MFTILEINQIWCTFRRRMRELSRNTKGQPIMFCIWLSQVESKVITITLTTSSFIKDDIQIKIFICLPANLHRNMKFHEAEYSDLPSNKKIKKLHY